MNHLVFLDTYTGELEKILSGFKNMIVIEINTAQPVTHLVRPGDSLYFLRNRDECTLRVKATVVRVIPFINGLDEDLQQTLKELQPRLQLTESQFYYWSMKKEILLVEFNCAQKIKEIHVEADKVSGQSNWIPFEEFKLIS